MKRLISQRTTSDDNILDTVQEEFTGFAGPGDTTNSGCRLLWAGPVTMVMVMS